MIRHVLPPVALIAALVGAIAAPSAAQTDLQALIDAASPGDVIVLEAGTYRGGVTIDKPLTIRGNDWPIVDAGGSGSVFLIDSPDVTIEGLLIRNTGDSLDRENAGVSSDRSPRLVVRNNRFEDVLFGVFARTSPEAQIVDNVVGAKDLPPGRRGDGIRVWECPNSLIAGNEVVGGRDTVMWFTDNVVVRDNYVAEGRYGLHFMYSDNALVEGNSLTGNSVGMFLMYSRDVTLRDNVMADNNGPSGYGVGLKDIDGITATGNLLIGNRAGLYLDNSPASYDMHQTFSGNLFAYNDVGVLFLPAVERNHFTGNAFVDNGEQVGVQGSGTFDGNTWTVDGVGNYWSDFAGYDADGDGLGDTAYKLDDLFSELTDDHPELAFFAETPASRAVDLAAAMFPVFRPRPKVEDTAPLISRPTITANRPVAGAPVASTALVSLTLLGGAAVVTTFARGRRRLIAA